MFGTTINKLVIFLFCLMVFFYVGEENGKMISGIQGRIGDEKGIYLMADTKSYIEEWLGNSFRPSGVDYKIEGSVGAVIIGHKCEHVVDQPKIQKDTYSYLMGRAIF